MGSRTFWLARARRLTLRSNLASCLDIFLPLALALGVAGAAGLLLLRTLKIPSAPLWICLGAALLAAAAVSWRFVRKKFLNQTDALGRLDAVGRLHNRLTAAHAGVGEWPEARDVWDATRWNWARVLGPIALAAMVLCGAAFLPVPQTGSSAHAVEPPLAWTQLESWLQTLEQANVIEPDALQKLHEQLNDLSQQPPENWYSQSSLEAGDTLRQQTEQALRAMLRDLEKSEQALAVAEKSRETLPPGELKALHDSLQQSLRGLELGNLPLNKELLRDLKKLDPSKLKQLSQSQLAEMREKIKAGTSVAERCVGPTPKLGNSLFAEQQSGGTGGGGSPAPLALKQDPTNLRTKQTETVSNEDLSRAAPGDVVGLDKGEHEVEKIKTTGAAAGGSVQSLGAGGEAVWRDSLTPQEREVLQRFFK